MSKMNNFKILGFCLLISFFAHAKTPKEQLLALTNQCLENFDESEEAKIINDFKNGYREVSGNFPTCGCFCKSAATYFVGKDRRKLFLSTFFESCDQIFSFKSSTPFLDLLPAEFSLKSFLQESSGKQDKESYFFIKVELPRKGTDLILELEFLQAGKKKECPRYLCFDNSSSELPSEFMNRPEIIRTAKTEKELLQFIGSKHEKAQVIEHLKMLYQSSKQVKYKRVILKWDKKQFKFKVKKKVPAEPYKDFLDFSRKVPFFTPAC